MLPYWHFTFADEFLYCVYKLRSGLLNERGWKFGNIWMEIRFFRASVRYRLPRPLPETVERSEPDEMFSVDGVTPASVRKRNPSPSITHCVYCTHEKKNFPFFRDTGGQESRVHAFEAGREETRLRPRPLLDRPLGSCNGDPSVWRAAKCPEYEMRNARHRGRNWRWSAAVLRRDVEITYRMS